MAFGQTVLNRGMCHFMDSEDTGLTYQENSKCLTVLKGKHLSAISEKANILKSSLFSYKFAEK